MASSNKKDIMFLDELCCVCSLIDPKAPYPAKGTSAFPRDADPHQSASKALFVAPRYSDFFLCFIHIFLRRLGVPHRLPPVSGREASAPGGRARSYSVVFLQCCLWLTNKTQMCTERFSLALLPCLWQQPLRTKSCLARKVCPCLAHPWDWQVWNEQGLCGSGGWDAAAATTQLGALVPSLSEGRLTQGDRLQVGPL